MSAWTLKEADDALRRLLDATIAREKATAARDAEVAKVQQKHAAAIDKAAAEEAALEAQLREYFTAHQAELCPEGRKSHQFTHGLLGTRSAAQPALVPLNDKWTWEKIAKKLRRAFKARFFHAPKAPGIDKVKVKRELTAEELAACGMKLDDSESFYLELNRLAPASGIAA